MNTNNRLLIITLLILFAVIIGTVNANFTINIKDDYNNETIPTANITLQTYINQITSYNQVWTDLSATDADNWVGTSAVYSVFAYNETAVYIGIGDGKFGVYNPVTNVWTDLSATDAGNWVGTSIVYSVFAYNNTAVYTGIAAGKFGVYDPVTNVWTDLSATDAGDWVGTGAVRSVYAYNETAVYTASDSGKFGVYNPVTNVWTDLSATDAGDWVGTTIVQSVFAYNNTAVYTGLRAGKFGVYDPVTNVWTDLSATDTGNWVGTSDLFAVSVFNVSAIYTGIDTGKFGVYNPLTPVFSTVLNTFTYNTSNGSIVTDIVNDHDYLVNVSADSAYLKGYETKNVYNHNTSSNLTVYLVSLNIVPVVSSVIVSPVPAFVFDNLSGSGSYFDADGDIESGSSFRWFLNGVVIVGATSNTLGAGNFSKGDNITFEYTPKDGYMFGESVNSSVLTISNSLPSTPDINISSPVFVGSVLEVNASSTDADGDLLTYYYEFFNINDSSYVKNFSTNNTYLITINDAHKTLRVRVKAFDGEEYGGVKEQNISVSDTVPVVSSVIVSPVPSFVFDNLSGSGSYFDADGDVESGSSFRWFLNGVVIVGAASNTLGAGNFSKGDNITFEYTPCNSFDCGVPVNGSEITISAYTPGVVTSLFAENFKEWVVLYWTNSFFLDYVMVYFEGVNVANVSDEKYNFTGLFPDSSYEVLLYSVSLDDTINNTPINITIYSLENDYPNISKIVTYEGLFLAENQTIDFEVIVTDQETNIFVEWFLNAVSVFTEWIVSGAKSVWSWSIGYQDSGEYNITVNATDYYNYTSSVSWSLTVEDTFPIPSPPVMVSPSGGAVEYSVSLACVIDFVPVQPAYFEWVLSVNGSNYTDMKVRSSYSSFIHDISFFPYGTNFSYGCRVDSPSGVGNYTYSSNFTKIKMNHFFVFVPKGFSQPKAFSPYQLGFNAEITNLMNATIAGAFVDCNGNGVWDYSYDYRGLNASSASETFVCINPKGNRVSTVGMVLYKNNSASWASLGCTGLRPTDNYCIVYKSYSVVVV